MDSNDFLMACMTGVLEDLHSLKWWTQRRGGQLTSDVPRLALTYQPVWGALPLVGMHLRRPLHPTEILTLEIAQDVAKIWLDNGHIMVAAPPHDASMALHAFELCDPASIDKLVLKLRQILAQTENL